MLRFETERYSNTNGSNGNEINKIYCFHCKNIESEIGIKFQCPIYLDERKLLAENIYDVTCIVYIYSRT